MGDTRRCYIHVGLPKTGTSYLQSIFRLSERALAEQGLDLLPRTTVGRRYLTVALRGRLDPETDPPRAFRVLDRLAQEARAATGDRALISQEVLGALVPDEISTLLEALPGYEPHVILTVRDLARTLPSGWQQEMQQRVTTRMEDFVAGFMHHEDPAYQHHRRRAVESVLDRWESHVPPHRIHVVTVPPPSGGPDAVLERYCQVLGVDPDTLDRTAARRNSSLGLVQAELMRRVNAAVGERLTHPRGEYDAQAKRYLAKQVLLPQGGRPPRLPDSVRAWCMEASDAVIRRLSTGGYDVVGDLGELRPDPASFSSAEESVSEAEMLAAAVEAIAAMLVDRARADDADAPDVAAE